MGGERGRREREAKEDEEGRGAEQSSRAWRVERAKPRRTRVSTERRAEQSRAEQSRAEQLT
ncbi:hypothetical protein IAQ61_000612 [Plenodomus lingam]|uniref:uncharacterized protein n=1 Tax=Leptosphaeria maculans TaxID=5022 RepID=UPI00331852CB|nr:hypothetical protein IAQ61_000612 [Plenodomus lingam]